MGRWCYFNTEVQFKFWFGVQNSSDIELFGGASHLIFRVDPGDWEDHYLGDCETDEEKNDEQKRLDLLKAWAGDRDRFISQDLPEWVTGSDIEKYFDDGHSWEGVTYEEVLEKCKQTVTDEDDWENLDEASPAFSVLMKPSEMDAYLRRWPLTQEGTDAMLDDIETHWFDKDCKNQEAKALWELGMAIAHQLLYQDDLSCTYEC
jgi:hypothetical protein